MRPTTGTQAPASSSRSRRSSAELRVDARELRGAAAAAGRARSRSGTNALPRNAPVTSRPDRRPGSARTRSATRPRRSRLRATVRYCWKPCSTPRRTETIIQIIAVTGIAAAAHSSSTLISAAIRERSGIATTATATVPTTSRISQRYDAGAGVRVALGDVVADLAGGRDLQRRARDHHDDERREQHGQVAVAGSAQYAGEDDREAERQDVGDDHRRARARRRGPCRSASGRRRVREGSQTPRQSTPEQARRVAVVVARGEHRSRRATTAAGAAGGAPRRPTTSATTTRSGGGRSPTTAASTSGWCWRASSRGCRG